MKKSWMLLLLCVAAVWGMTGCQGAETTELRFTGSVEADQIDLTPETAGIIESVEIEGGSTVAAGDVLVKLDMSDYDEKLEMARTAVEIAKLKVEDLMDGSSNSSIRQARSNLASVSAQVEGAAKELGYLEGNLEDAKALFDAGAASQSEVDNAARLFDKGKAAYESLVEQEAALTSALDGIIEGASDEALKAAELEVELRQLELKQLENTVSKGILTSPVDAFVQSVNYQRGERVAPGQRVVTLVDLSHLWMKIYVPEKELYRIKPGMSAVFTDPFLKGQPVSGEVTYISSSAEFTPKNIESRENKQEMVYEVQITVKDLSGVIKPGMFLEVVLQEGTK